MKSFTPGANDFVYLSMRTNRDLMSIPAINNQIRALAESCGVRLIDLAAHTSTNNGSTWSNPSRDTVDGTHYTDTVRDWIAD